MQSAAIQIGAVWLESWTVSGATCGQLMLAPSQKAEGVGWRSPALVVCGGGRVQLACRATLSSPTAAGLRRLAGGWRLCHRLLDGRGREGS